MLSSFDRAGRAPLQARFVGFSAHLRKSLLFPGLAAALLAGGLLGAADVQPLGAVRTVYFWPMSSSLDQYLAEQITAEGLFEVVVDPKLATAVMTERIDAPFLQAMDQVFPMPEPAAEGKPPEAEKKAAETAKDKKEGDSLEGEFRVERPANRAVSRPHGTLFLVDVRSRKVLWSTFLKEYNRTPNELHKQARQVVSEIKKRLKPGT